MTNRRRFLRAVVSGVLVVLLAACGGSDAGGRAGEELGSFGDALPDEVLGLRVSEEEPGSAIDSVASSYLSTFGLYALRDGDLLQATVQVGTLASDDLDVTSSEFRRRVALNIGGQESQPFRMGSQTVYLTAGRKQSISIWFDDADMYVLSVRDTYDTPRSLLRAIVEHGTSEDEA